MASNVVSKWLLLVMAALAATSCQDGVLPPTVWPPQNFRLVVEESRAEGEFVHVVRRLQIDAQGQVIYGTSAAPLLDQAAGTSLPVFDRLSVYVLEPSCVRGLARRLDRLGIGELAVSPSSGASATGPVLSISWQAFTKECVLPSSGRLRGPMVEVMAVIASYLPPGEAFDTEIGRPTKKLLRGAPVPRKNASGALLAYRDLLRASPMDHDLILAAYGLACSLKDRSDAEQLLEQWRELESSQASRSGFQGDPQESVEERAKLLSAFLPTI